MLALTFPCNGLKAQIGSTPEGCILAGVVRFRAVRRCPLMARLCPWRFWFKEDQRILREASYGALADLAEQLAPALAAAPPEAIARAAERCPSLRRYPVGMASPKVRTALRSGDISAWDLDRQLAVAASLGLRVRIVLEPA